VGLGIPEYEAVRFEGGFRRVESCLRTLRTSDEIKRAKEMWNALALRRSLVGEARRTNKRYAFNEKAGTGY
jgi:hypothetical protein